MAPATICVTVCSHCVFTVYAHSVCSQSLQISQYSRGCRSNVYPDLDLGACSTIKCVSG